MEPFPAPLGTRGEIGAAGTVRPLPRGAGGRPTTQGCRRRHVHPNGFEPLTS